MTAHLRRYRPPRPADDDTPDDFPVSPADARRYLALAEHYLWLWARSDDPVERHRLARAVRDYRSFAARCKDRRTSNG
jgi:hypothetical protein